MIKMLLMSILWLVLCLQSSSAGGGKFTRYEVKLRYGDGPLGGLTTFCSGALITRRHVLTSAHCAQYFNRYGVFKIQSVAIEIPYAVKPYIYNVSSKNSYERGGFYFDLPEPRVDNLEIITLDRDVDPVLAFSPLALNGPVPDLSTQIAGRPLTNYTVHDLAYCQENLKMPILSPDFLCASRDSSSRFGFVLNGSPLVKQWEWMAGMPAVVGIWNFKPRGWMPHLNGFANVAAYSDFIRDVFQRPENQDVRDDLRFV